MAKEISLLMVAYYFPPNAAVGGKRIARFCNYLPALGIRPYILTLDQESCASLDHSFVQLDNFQIERVRPRSTPLDWYKKVLPRTGGTQNPAPEVQEDTQRKKNLTKTISDGLIALLTIPDQQWGWYFPASRAGAKLIREKKFDAIMSSGPPWTAHAIGHKLSRRFGIPWIVDFRDGWVSDQWRDEHPDWRHKVDWRIEDGWLKDSSLVLTTTERLKDSLASTHPEVPSSRIVTITNGFDGELLQDQKPTAAKDRIVFLHAGELYRGRRIDTFCSALSSLVSNGSFRDVQPKVIFIGETAPEIERTARDAAPELFAAGMVEFRPPVSWKVAQAELAAADILLLVQGDHPTAIPAKFFEYLKTGKPILGIGQGGALKDIIEDTRSGVVVDPLAQEEISQGIQKTIGMRPRTPEEIAQIAGKYHFKNLTAELAAKIHEIVS